MGFECHLLTAGSPFSHFPTTLTIRESGDLRSCGDGIGVFTGQLGDRHREIANQRCVNEIPEVDDTCYALAVYEGVQSTDVIVDDLRALLLQSWKNL